MSFHLFEIYNTQSNQFTSKLIKEFKRKPSIQSIKKHIPDFEDNHTDYIMNEYITCITDKLYLLKRIEL